MSQQFRTAGRAELANVASVRRDAADAGNHVVGIVARPVVAGLRAGAFRSGNDQTFLLVGPPPVREPPDDSSNLDAADLLRQLGLFSFGRVLVLLVEFPQDGRLLGTVVPVRLVLDVCRLESANVIIFLKNLSTLK